MSLTISAQQTTLVEQDHEVHGKRVSSVLEARGYWHQFPGVEEALERLPRDATVDVLCADGWLKLRRLPAGSR